MSSGYPIREPEVMFNHNDLNEIVASLNLVMPHELHAAFLLRFGKEIEKAAQDGIIVEVQNLLANPHVANVFKISKRETES